MAKTRTTEADAPQLPENMNGKCPSCGDNLLGNTSTARHSVRGQNEERCGVTTHDGACAGAHYESCDAFERASSL